MTSLSRSESGRHIIMEAPPPPSYRRAPVECTECNREGKDCTVFEGDGHGRCRWCHHHRATHLDVLSVCADCVRVHKRCEHFTGSGSTCSSCRHSRVAHGVQTEIGGLREPVQCSECAARGHECKVFKGDGTRHCLNCGHHDVCHEDHIIGMKGTRSPVYCSECDLQGKKCDTYREWQDRRCEFCGHHDVCHQAAALRVPADSMQAALDADIGKVAHS